MNGIIKIDKQGNIEAMNFDLKRLGYENVTHRRLSHIWPCSFWKRQAFRLVRAIFGDRGLMAAWTRRWVGPWQVRLVSNTRHVAYTAAFRDWCVQWEHEHVTKHNCHEE